MEDNFEIYKQLRIGEGEHTLGPREAMAIIEALLFTSGEPLSLEDICDVLDIDKKSCQILIEKMTEEFDSHGRGIQIICFNNKYQLCTRPEYTDYIRKLLKPQNKQSLSRAAVEVIAIIAYKQPITRQAIDSIRGVKCDRIINSLIEKRLIREVGRLDSPGRPKLYGTTDEFLRYFGLKNLDELPKIEDFKPTE